MRTLEETWAGLGEAFSKKTISLLSNQHARFYLALFEALFEPVSASVGYPELAARMNVMITDFAEREEYRRLCPQEGGEPKGADAILRSLTDEYRWVEKSILNDGSVSCRLTTDAMEALSIVNRLNERRTLMSGPRMQTIVDTIGRAKVALSEDYEQGRALLEEQVALAQKNLDEYISTHGASKGGGFLVLDYINNLNDLIGAMPADISRFEDAIRTSNAQLRQEIALGNLPAGTITRRHYEERYQEGLSQYRQSYRDALQVKSSYEQGDSIFGSLREIDRQAATIGEGPTQSLMATWREVTSSIERISGVEVTSSTLVNNAITKAMEKDSHEMAKVLAELEAACLKWAERAPARGKVGLEGFLSQAETASVATSLGDPARELYTEALWVTEATVDPSAFRDLWREGAPRTERILALVKRVVAPGESIVAAFNGLDAEDRRVCELFGLIDYAARAGSELEPCGGEAAWELVDLFGADVRWRSEDIRLANRDETQVEGS